VAEPTPAESHWAGDYATGEWSGVRPALGDRGLTVGLIYTAEIVRTTDQEPSAAAPVGYLALVDAWLNLDGGKARWWPGGQFFLGVQHAHSQGHVGQLETFQLVSNIDTPGFTQLGECFFEQRFDRAGAWFRFGKQDSNREFGSPRYSGNFINDAFGDVPTIPMPSHPAPALGLFAGARLTRLLRGLVGVLEGRPEPGGIGFATAFERERGVFAVAELELVTSEPVAERPAGRHSLAVWYHSAGRRHLLPFGAPPARNYGAFVSLDQRIYRTDAGGTGLHVFVRAALSPADLDEASAYAGAGVAYHGIGSRFDDTVGLGFSTVWLERPTGRSAESALELFYKARFAHFLSLQPDLQLYRQPQGQPGYGWAATLRLRVKL
jgi:porin